MSLYLSGNLVKSPGLYGDLTRYLKRESRPTEDLASPEGVSDCGSRNADLIGHGAWSLQFKSFKSLKSSIIKLTAHRDKID